MKYDQDQNEQIDHLPCSTDLLDFPPQVSSVLLWGKKSSLAVFFGNQFDISSLFLSALTGAVEDHF